MRRRLVGKLVFGLAALWLIASLLVWWVSYRRAPAIERTGTRTNAGLSITVGQLGLWVNRHPGGAGEPRWQWALGPAAIDFQRLGFPANATDFSLLGFRVVHQGLSPDDHYYLMELPFWLMAAVPGSLILVQVWRRWRARRRLLMGHCAVCGYDLRASPDRCPECGTLRSSPDVTTVSAR